MLKSTTTTTTTTGGSEPEGEDVIHYGEENAIVLDRWLYDVCGEEDMHFPSHRRAQFAPYMQRVRAIVRQKDYLQGSFSYPSRSGTRETLVLQKTLEALGLRETRLLQERQRVEDNIARVQRVLQQSALPRPVVAPPEVNRREEHEEDEEETREEGREAGEQREEEEEKMSTPIVTSPASSQGSNNKEEEEGGQHADEEEEEEEEAAAPPTPRNTAVVVEEVEAEEDGRAADNDNNDNNDNNGEGAEEEIAEAPPAPPAAVPLTETAEYKEKLRLAARYVADLQEKLRQMQEQRAALLDRHQRLLAQDAALERELRALSDDEAQWRSREAEMHDAVTQREATLQDLQRQWQEANEKESTDEKEQDMKAHDEEEKSGETTMARLAALRRSLSETSLAAEEARNTMLREEQTHLTRFRLSRERLREWQDIVANLRKTAHQLEGQVSVVTRVVRQSALRMHEKPGDGGFLDRLQQAAQLPSSPPLAATHAAGDGEEGGMHELSPPGPHTAGASLTSGGGRSTPRAMSISSAEPPHYSTATTNAGTNNAALTRAALLSRTAQQQQQQQQSPQQAPTGSRASTGGGAAGPRTPPLVPLSAASVARQPRAASCSAMSLASTPNSRRGGGQSGGAAVHRSRYDLVSHLQRWATVLEQDRVRLVQAAGLVPSANGATGPNVQSPPVGSSVQTRQAQMRQSFALLKSILLARVTSSA